MSEPTTKPGLLLHAARRLGLSFASVLATLLLFATATSARAHAWTWVQLGVSALLLTFGVTLPLVLPRRPRAHGIALALCLLGLARIGYAAAPRRAVEHPEALVRTRFVSSPPDTRLWWQGIPERETVALGALVGLSRREYERGGPAIDAAYAEVAARGLFQRDESPLLDSWCFDHEHFWLAVPERPKPPLIVFVHGHGGTFEFYPHLLAREAVRLGFAIAFPSNGFGIWHGRDAADRIARVVDSVAREVEIDRSRVMLVGLSAGGDGIFAAALAEPERYRAIVAISAVFPDLESSAVLKGKKVLLLHGAEDPRASVDGARRAREALARNGALVELDEQAGEDHLALLTAKERWVPRVLAWLASD